MRDGPAELIGPADADRERITPNTATFGRNGGSALERSGGRVGSMVDG
jgi:hypothetical protein